MNNLLNKNDINIIFNDKIKEINLWRLIASFFWGWIMILFFSFFLKIILQFIGIYII